LEDEDEEEFREEVIAWNTDDEKSEMLVFLDNEADHRNWVLMFKPTNQKEECSILTLQFGLVEQKFFEKFKCLKEDEN